MARHEDAPALTPERPPDDTPAPADEARGEARAWLVALLSDRAERVEGPMPAASDSDNP